MEDRAAPEKPKLGKENAKSVGWRSASISRAKVLLSEPC
jgi:hypothetical protein